MSTGIAVVVVEARDEAMAADIAEVLVHERIWFQCDWREHHWVFRVDQEDERAALFAIAGVSR